MLNWAADKISSARNMLFINDHKNHPKNQNIKMPEADFSSSPQYGLIHFNNNFENKSLSSEAIDYSNMTKPTGVLYQDTENSYNNNIISFDKKATPSTTHSITATKTYNGVRITEDNMTIDFSTRPKNDTINY